jgi:ribosomal protein S27E
MHLCHLSVPPLPFAPRPFPDELLLSWICRLAAANHVILRLLFPETQAMNHYRLNCDPGEEIVARLAAMARVPQSTLHSLLLPNQFPNLPLLSFLRVPDAANISGNEDTSESFPLPFCSDCAGKEERARQSLYWQAETGLLTTILCPKHGTFFGLDCPGCNRFQLTLAWDQAHLIVRCLRCGWRPVAPPKRTPVPLCPSGLRQLLFRLQHDLIAALRGQPPSIFWCGKVSAVQFLRVVDDLYWLLRTPGLSAHYGQNFMFTDGLSWVRLRNNSRTLFGRIRYLPFAAWDSGSRADLLLSIATTMLGIRAFETLGSKPDYPIPSVSYPWDWILPALNKPHAQELLSRVANWPPILRLPVFIAVGVTIKPFLPGDYSTK